MNTNDNLPAIYSVGDLEIMAEKVAKSGLFGLQAPQAFALMLLCQAKGLHPIQAVERYHVIQGRPAMRADAMNAEYQARDGHVEWKTTTATECEAVFSHPKHAPKGNVSRFTVDDARKAEILGNPTWKKYPANMLRARVISNGIRMTMPGIVSGIYTPEEVQDMGPGPGPVLDASYAVVDADAGAPSGSRHANGKSPASKPTREPSRPTPPAKGLPASRAEEQRVALDVWGTYLAKAFGDARRAWDDEMEREGVEPARREELTNPSRIIHAVCSRATAKGLILFDDICKADKPTVKDPARVKLAVAMLYARRPAGVTSAVEGYLDEKRSALRVKLGLPDLDAEHAVLDGRERQPGEDDE